MVKKTRKRVSREERKGRSMVACVRFRVSYRSNVSSFTIKSRGEMKENGCHCEETLFTRFQLEKNLADYIRSWSLIYHCVRWFKKHDNSFNINTPTLKYHPKVKKRWNNVRNSSSNWLQPNFVQSLSYKVSENPIVDEHHVREIRGVHRTKRETRVTISWMRYL